MGADYYDDEFYEDDFTDDDDDDHSQERGSSQGLIENRNVQNFRLTKSVQQKPTTSKSGVVFRKRDPKSAIMARKGEARVRSSKRRAQHLIRNQLAELSVSHDELLKENKILKQIQKRQEKELDRYTNAEEDIPRLLDANSFEIAGLKSKNKQLMFERRENEDKLRRQHQEIITLKDSNKKITNLANNKKLGEREKLEIDLTTARVTIAHQENRIQDLTKAVEIYKKNADRESKGSQLQLKKTQNNLRDLQDAYNDLFIKYKAKERESGNSNIYVQRIRQVKRTPSQTLRHKSQTNLIVESFNSTAKSTPRRGKHKSTEQISNHQDSSFEVLETELQSQTQSLVYLQEDIATPRKREDSPEKMRPKTSSTLSSDGEIEESDGPVEEEEEIVEEDTHSMIAPPMKKSEMHIISTDIQKKQIKPSVDVLSNEENRLSEERRRAHGALEEKQRQAEGLAKEKLEEEKRRGNERRLAEQKESEERRRQAEEMRKVEEARRADQERKEVEKRQKEEAEKQREADLLAEKKAKDEALKNKLAAMRSKAGGGDDFMSQLKAKSKKNTPVTSPLTVEETSPAPIEHSINKSGSGDNFRKNAVLNNSSRLTPKKDEEFTGYQPSFAGRRAQKKESISAEINNEYTPSFSNSQRISREKLHNTVEPPTNKSWTPVGKASGGLFDDKQKPLMARRSSSNKNVLSTRNPSDEDLEELLL